MSGVPVDTALAGVYRDDVSRILATLVRLTRDLDAAEDALHDAMTRAIETWPRDGVPANPAGWVSTTAQRIAIDAARRAASFQTKAPLLAVPDEPDTGLQATDVAFRDDRLRLIFTCCHPVLTPESRVALTLRLICGLSTEQIAALYLVPTPTMAARITRAKKSLSASAVPYEIPAPDQLEARLHDVLTVVYLVATSGYAPAGSELMQDPQRMQIALDLTRVLDELLPTQAEVLGLRALVLFAHARQETQMDAEGVAITLEQMDRSRWDQGIIADGIRCTEAALRWSKPETVGPYALQAGIAAVHMEAPTYADTDWAQIVALYAVLDHRHPGPTVRLAYAIAVGMCDGADIGLRMIELSNLDHALRTYPMLSAARADLHRRAGRYTTAADYYRAAARLTGNDALRDWFQRQAEIMAPT